RDAKVNEGAAVARKADPTVPGQVGATLSGSVLRVLVEPGNVVKQGDPLMVTEAMKMETTLTAPVDGRVKEVLVKAASKIQSGDLLVVIE
ncbi:MAG: biotin/lipoyl-binding protein, partial [Acidaminococcus sp.]|nr:biotin/lipoyl-binding protein [Acidaminococcus sp.]